MKNNLRLNQITALFMILLLCIYAGTAYTQQKPNKPQSDTTRTELARRINVSNDRAQRINAAMHFQSQEIQRVMKDTSLNISAKQVMLRRLFFQRKMMMDSVITPDEKSKMKQAFAGGLQSQRRDIDNRRKIQLARMTSKGRLVSSRTDTSATIKKPAKP